jgi:hypothetical protein
LVITLFVLKAGSFPYYNKKRAAPATQAGGTRNPKRPYGMKDEEKLFLFFC